MSWEKSKLVSEPLEGTDLEITVYIYTYIFTVHIIMNKYVWKLFYTIFVTCLSN